MGKFHAIGGDLNGPDALASAFPNNFIDLAVFDLPQLAAIFGGNGLYYGSGAGKGGGPGHGGSGSTTNSGSTSGGTTPTPGGPSSLLINVNWDSSVANAPSAFKTAVMAAVQYLEARFSDPVSITIDVGYGEVSGTTLSSGDLGESRWALTSTSYSQLRSALTAGATTANDATAIASLPSTSPVNGTFWLTTAQAEALGLAPSSGDGLNGSVGFSSTLPFSYTDTNGVAAGTYDFEAVALHEITEVLGRDLLTGGTIGGISPSYSAADLFHYSSAGVRDFSASTPGYFSINGGTTNLDPYNTNSGGDAGDWGSGAGHDSFDAFSSAGVINSISNADLTELDVVGWDRTSSNLTAPTGVSVSPLTATLAGLQGTGGLTASHQVASVIATGGYSVDQTTYALGGTGASSFVLVAGNNGATLSTSAAGAPGALNGLLYQLTVTATDTTDGLSSPAVPLDVIVGSSGADTIDVSAVVGVAGTATPTFIYGLGGNDTINGSGMSGALWIAPGAGADTLTGGSGVNHYLFAATGDSAGSAMDVITNFHAATDCIDLTGLGTALQCEGALSGSTLNSQSVGWQQSGGNTYVYVNTTAASEALGSTNMAIELQGTIALASSNILHA